MVYTQFFRKMFKLLKEEKMNAVQLLLLLSINHFTTQIQRNGKRNHAFVKDIFKYFLLSTGINNFCKISKLEPHVSATKFVRSNIFYIQHFSRSQNMMKFPEHVSEKEVSYYVFQTKGERYIKSGEEKTYTRNAESIKRRSQIDS